jgi:hypothetical protein
MTAQKSHDNRPDPQPSSVELPGADPIGPITMPKRSLIGSRAFALVGSASVLAVAVMATEECSTWHTISA